MSTDAESFKITTCFIFLVKKTQTPRNFPLSQLWRKHFQSDASFDVQTLGSNDGEL